MNIQIHQGGDKIGGNCVEISTATTRIILDVGIPVEALQDKAEPVLPDVPGLFTPGPKIDAILLSHAHGDHTGLLGKTCKGIPIYCTELTRKVLWVSRAFVPNTPYLRRINWLNPGHPVQIGDLTVTPFSVDHSSPGSVALLIEHDGQRVLYSGDLRLHGRKPGMFKTLVKALKDKSIDTLILEGTHVGQPRRAGKTEWGLESLILDEIKSAKGKLVLAVFSPQNLDRLVTFLRAAKQARRIFVADLYTACLMDAVCGHVKIPPPRRMSGVRVFFNPSRLALKKMPGLEQSVYAVNPLSWDEIQSDPGRYVMISRPSMIKRDFKGKLPEGTRLIYSMWSGYLEKDDWMEAKEVLIAAQGELVKLNSGGHITLEDMRMFIQAVNPKEIMPIHTQFPDAFKTLVEDLNITIKTS